MNKVLAGLFVGVISTSSVALAQFSITPLSGFSPNGDGWFAPGEGGYGFLGTGNLERGLAFGNDHLYLVSRTGGNSIRILNKLTGAEIGTLDTTGITGGTFAVNLAAVGGDGAIYVNNLTTQSTTSPLKIYRWATEGSAPTVAYTGNGALAGARVGDSMAITGSGASTQLALGYGSSPVVAGNNGYAIVDPTAGTATAVSFSGNPPAPGDFRLGITFGDADEVFGSQAGGVVRYTTFAGGTGTLVSSSTLSSTAERLLAYAVVGGVPLLAAQSTGDGHVSIYDVTDPTAPALLGSGLAITGTPASNGNGVGQLAWGDIQGDTAHLWAMSANQGIQAFTVTVPEPSTIAGLAIGGAFLAGHWLRRRNRA